jgi:putative salt-induced outer membrane protein YdiY
MNWDAIGAIAEVLGALAVFLTLVYLALQIRQNTKAVRSSAVDASINSVMSVRGMMAQDSELADIFLRGNADPASLTANEYLRYRLLLQNVTWSAWNVYSQASYADTGVWNSQKAVMQRIFLSPGGRQFFEEYAQELDSNFRLEIQKVIDEARAT